MSRRVTLTFDNGPTPMVTPLVLDALSAEGVRATFFVVGNELAREGRRALAQRAVDESHWIGNHTATHEVQFGLVANLEDPGVPEAEIEDAQRVIGDLARPERLFRPYGQGAIGPHLLSSAAVRHLVQHRYTCVLWNSVPRDWEEPDAWVERCLADIETHHWSLVVLHDVDGGAMRHLASFLAALRDRGREIVQAFPDTCVPIQQGKIVGRIEDLVAATARSTAN